MNTILEYRSQPVGTPPRVRTANHLAFIASWFIVWPVAWAILLVPLFLVTTDEGLIPFIHGTMILGPSIGLVCAIIALLLESKHWGNLSVGLIGCAAWIVLLSFFPLIGTSPGRVSP